jgi:hypothetical protein
MHFMMIQTSSSSQPTRFLTSAPFIRITRCWTLPWNCLCFPCFYWCSLEAILGLVRSTKSVRVVAKAQRSTCHFLVAQVITRWGVLLMRSWLHPHSDSSLISSLFQPGEILLPKGYHQTILNLKMLKLRIPLSFFCKENRWAGTPWS